MQSMPTHAMHGSSFTPIAQGLVHDKNATHAFGLRESKHTYGSVSTPKPEGLVENINAKDAKVVMSPLIAQGLVGTHAISKHVGPYLCQKRNEKR